MAQVVVGSSVGRGDDEDTYTQFDYVGFSLAMFDYREICVDFIVRTVPLVKTIICMSIQHSRHMSRKLHVESSEKARPWEHRVSRPGSTVNILSNS